jgi:two-component system, OmpR family, sensor histidine kinase KdpD
MRSAFVSTRQGADQGHLRGLLWRLLLRVFPGERQIDRIEPLFKDRGIEEWLAVSLRRIAPARVWVNVVDHAAVENNRVISPAIVAAIHADGGASQVHADQPGDASIEAMPGAPGRLIGNTKMRSTMRERRTRAMYAMARELGAAPTTGQIIEIGIRHVGEGFHVRAAILLPDSAEKIRQKIDESAPAVLLDAGVLDLDIGQWVYDQQKPAGRGTDTLPSTGVLYLPLKAPTRTRGVLALVPDEVSELASPEEQCTLDAFAAQIALALERVHYVEIAQDALVNVESERLRNSLLSAISHDLRTPLTAIIGFASMLAEQKNGEKSQRANTGIVDAIYEEALRMYGLVTNLLDMARLEAGGVHLRRQWMTLEEVVGAALGACRRMLDGRPVQVQVPPELPLLQLEVVLMERLFANLFDNAAKYTLPGTSLSIVATATHEGGRKYVKVCVDDSGPGLPTGMETRIFDKFTRGERESAKPGAGLGLAICQVILDAHDGVIGAENRIDALGNVIGARFWFTLPADEVPTDLPSETWPDEVQQASAGVRR